MATPEHIENQAPISDLEASMAAIEFPLLDAKTKAELTRIARGLGRTTSTGVRALSGSIISLEGQAVAQMMERNQLQNEGGEQNG